jgi:glutathione S-transferase
MGIGPIAPCGRRTERVMSLKLYLHPLSSFCQKVLIALYENGTPFEPHVVDLMKTDEAAAFRKIWPMGRFPVLRDEARNRTIPESSIIIEYLDLHYPGTTRFLPEHPDLANRTRMLDRFFDLDVNVPVGKIVTDRLRPAGKNDALGVEAAKTQLRTALGVVEQDMERKAWAIGETFSMADCAAAPALFYANLVLPFGSSHRNAAAYLDRLMHRPSFARAVKEAEPYRALFPK